MVHGKAILQEVNRHIGHRRTLSKFYSKNWRPPCARRILPEQYRSIGVENLTAIIGI